MASQTDIQQLIQSLVPSSVNNGNPNTIYNAPQYNAMGNLSSAAVNPAADNPAFSLPTLPQLNWAQWQAPTALAYQSGRTTGIPMPNFNGMGTTGWQAGGGGGTTPPGTIPGGNAGGGGGSVGGGGFTAPPGSTGGGVRGGLGTGGNGGLIGSALNGFGGAEAYGMGGGGASGGFGSDSSGSSGEGFFSRADGLWGYSPGLASSLGLKPDGGISWQQLLDVVSEPFISGNLWNSQTGTWNTSTLGNIVGGRFLGLPVGTIMNAIAQRQLNDNNPNNDNSWFVRQYMNNMQNRLMSGQNRANARTQNVLTDRLNQQFNQQQTDWSNQFINDATNRAMENFNNRLGQGTVTVGDPTVVQPGEHINYDNFNFGNNNDFSIGANGWGSGGPIGSYGSDLFGNSLSDSNWFGGSFGGTNNGGDWNGSLEYAFGPQGGNTTAGTTTTGTGNTTGSGGRAGTTSNGTAPAVTSGAPAGGFHRGTFNAGVLTGDAARGYFSSLASASDRAIAEALAAASRRAAR